MSDNDLIRRGDALEAAWEADSLELSTHGAKKIEARINTIPAVQPTVKPLVWVETLDGGCRAGDYRVAPSYGQGPENFMVSRGSNIIGWSDSADCCKQIAEQNNRFMTLAALGMQPTVSPKQLAAQPDDVAALVEALRSTLNFIENTEGEMGVIFGCGDKARAALARVKGVM